MHILGLRKNRYGAEYHCQYNINEMVLWTSSRNL